MKKFIYFFWIVFLFSCDNKQPIPIKKELKAEIKTSDNLNQRENSITKINFKIDIKEIDEENTTLYLDKTDWYADDMIIYTGENFIYTPKNIHSNTLIYAAVKYKLNDNDKEQKYRTNSLEVSVIGEYADLKIDTDDEKLEDNIVYRTIAENSLINFSSKILSASTITNDELKWYLENNNNEEEYLKDFDGLENISLKIEEPGFYKLTVKVLNGKFYSNSIFIDVSYGKLELEINGSRNQIDTFNNVELKANFKSTLKGRYEWYLNNTKLEDNNTSTYIHQASEYGGYIYKLKFIPEDINIKPIESDNYIIVHGKGVETEEELLTELGNETKGIILKNDIVYSKLDDPETGIKYPLQINNEVTISGNGHELKSKGIFEFIRVNHDNVNFYNITISKSGRYNVLLNKVKNIYFEDVILKEPGQSGSVTTPGAGIYLFGSEAIIKNVTILESYNSGIRIEGGNKEVDNKSILTIQNKFIYDEDKLLAPIISVRSPQSDVIVNALGFESFALPAGDGIMIRRWSSAEYQISWQLHSPLQTDYLLNEYLNLDGITITVKIGVESEMVFDMNFVFLYMDYFNGIGELVFKDINDKEVLNYYTTNHDGNLLIFKDKDNNNLENPLLPTEKGQYKVYIYIKDNIDTLREESLNLGYFLIEIK